MSSENIKNNFKWVLLIVLIAQSTALVLITRYSNTQNNPRYLSSTVIVTSEIVKFFTCLLIVLANNNWNWNIFKQEIYDQNFTRFKDMSQIGIPAFCYVIQNNLLFFALSKLDAATYQVTYQFKILTTAFFAVVLLKRKLIMIKWVSLILLTTGVALVQLPNDAKTPSSQDEELHNNKFSGFLALLAACVLSGFSGIYLEKILKDAPVSLWMKNSQLAFFSIFGGYLMVWIYDYEEVSRNGFFQGYTWVIWVVVLLQAYGGLLISLIVIYADNILKGFAVSLSIIFSSFISWQFLNDFSPTIAFLVGTIIVVASTFLYGFEPKKHFDMGTPCSLSKKEFSMKSTTLLHST